MCLKTQYFIISRVICEIILLSQIYGSHRAAKHRGPQLHHISDHFGEDRWAKITKIQPTNRINRSSYKTKKRLYEFPLKNVIKQSKLKNYKIEK